MPHLYEGIERRATHRMLWSTLLRLVPQRMAETESYLPALQKGRLSKHPQQGKDSRNKRVAHSLYQPQEKVPLGWVAG